GRLPRRRARERRGHHAGLRPDDLPLPRLHARCRTPSESARAFQTYAEAGFVPQGAGGRAAVRREHGTRSRVPAGGMTRPGGAVFKIGDFSRIARVSCRLLRYYDEIGLLKPGSTQRDSGYRYYSASQLPRLNRILVLKELGLSLEEIARVLDSNLSEAQAQLLEHEDAIEPR